MARPTEFLPLTPLQAEESRRKQGSNQLTAKRKKGFLRQFVGNLNDPVIRILLGALILNLLFSLTGEGADWYETGGIALAVLLATFISTLSEYSSEAAFSRLSEVCGSVSCRVRRRLNEGDTVCEIPLSDVVTGDIAVLGAGEMIPADGILLSGSLQVDQSAMTGESREVDKRPATRGDISTDTAPDPSNLHALLRGCVITGGNGEMLVTRVGDATFLGRISEEVQESTRESPLKLRLRKLAGQISRLGYVAAALVAIIYLLGAFLLDSGFDGQIVLQKLMDWRYVWEQLFHSLTLGLTVLVVAVPEGLPMMIAVVLSANIRKMVKDHVLVRKPAGIEAAGSMNLLFTDKTGTLTEGRLSIGRILTGDGKAFSDGEELRRASPRLFGYLADGCLCNTSSVAGQGEDGCRRALGGNATDRALMDAALPAWDREREILYRIPFDSVRKVSCAAIRRDGRETLLVKGAPERLLAALSGCYRPDGSRGELDKAALIRKIREMTERGGRVILCAEAVAERGRGISRQRAERGDFGELTLVCALLLTDRLRREAPESVRKLRRAGIQVVMMTGDNRDTARAIAESCGILGQGITGVVDSEELSRMTDEEIRKILPTLGVVARALPTDKSRLVRIAQAGELVVGMTGDGVNDAPALKRADVGFAMGAGTQVAKDAGDIIIMDNNLASIVKAVLYGRTIFKSIRKFITLQLTMNFSAVGITMICPLLGVDSPVTVVQMLWINLIMDTLGGLAFAGEAPLESYMKESPKRRDEPILNSYMVGEILWLGSFTVGLCLLFLKLPWITERFRPAEDHIYLLTAFFALFIFASVCNCFNARTDRLNLLAGLPRNKAFCLIMIAVLITQIIFVYLGGAVLRTAPLTAKELGITFLLALPVFPAELIRKIGRRLSGKNEGY